MANSLDTLLALSIPTLVLLHLFLAPYTKVEESFNIQAVHDILTHGFPDPFDANVKGWIKARYDHATFTGSVPRSFLGAAVLAGLTRPWMSFLSSPDQVQLVVRANLGLLNALCLVRFRTAVDVAYGRIAGRFYLLFVASSFHVLYYASRTLPNMLAFPLTTEALRAFVLSVSTASTSKPAIRRRRLSIYLLASSAIIFRSELALLMGAVVSSYYLYTRLSLKYELLPALDAAALIALPLTLGLDTLLWLPNLPPVMTLPWQTTWSYPLWPELQGFLFNAVSNKSAAWGVSPWHWYLSSALPRLLLNPVIPALCLPLAILLPAYRRTTLALLFPPFVFISIYSYLPHKEWRFIVYVLPLLLAPAAAGASYVFVRRSKTLLYRLLSILLLLSLALSSLISSYFLALSRQNYPGGHALALLHDLAPPVAGLKVHLANLACQTGVTRFQQLRPWIYDKTADEATLHDPMFWAGLDYAVVEDPRVAIGPWDVVGSVEVFDGVALAGGGRELAFFMVPQHWVPRTVEERLQKAVAGRPWPRLRTRTGLYVLKSGSMPV